MRLARRSPTPCRKPACGALCRDGTGYCADHQGEGWRRHQNGRTSTQRGYGAAWRKLRTVAIHRDKGLCQSCRAQGRHTAASEVDHITSKAQGGSDSIDNLQSLCARCHRAKSATEGRAAQG